MSPIWMIPALVVPIGGLVVGALVRQTAAATRELVVELDHLGEIAVAAAVVWDGVVQAGDSVHIRRQR